jgi:hypothetical protein
MKYATMPTVLILLLVLKLTAFPGLSLWIVTAPLWVPVILVLLILILEAFLK